ncbi:hypothetical protein B0H11DRAFT_2358567 [Mycena galericulata]|nr:hypothetical protein B0H11DRAFT_2358567 [Mycena galericulata]
MMYHLTNRAHSGRASTGGPAPTAGALRALDGPCTGGAPPSKIGDLFTLVIITVSRFLLPLSLLPFLPCASSASQSSAYGSLALASASLHAYAVLGALCAALAPFTRRLALPVLSLRAPPVLAPARPCAPARPPCACPPLAPALPPPLRPGFLAALRPRTLAPARPLHPRSGLARPSCSAHPALHPPLRPRSTRLRAPPPNHAVS